MIERVLAEIERHRTFVVTSHDPVDGDAIGSELGILSLLRSLGKEARIVNAGPLSRTYRFLPGADEVLVFPDGLDGPLDALVCLDCSRRDRIAPVADGVPAGTPVLNIDHHEGNEEFGSVNWIEPACSSTGEMVYDLAVRAGMTIPVEMATALYTAVATDTGRFSFSNTTPSAHRMAAALVELGVRPIELHETLYRKLPLGRLRLEAKAVERLRTTFGGRIAWTSVTQAMCREVDLPQEEAPDVVDIPLRLAGVELAVLFRELPDGCGTKVSFRSARRYPVHRFAERYGGGGHPTAAGCTIPQGLEEAEARILSDLETALEEASR
jgi:phosphoesterase RecJ-like protein